MAQTLYQRLGGAERISAIVHAAVDRHAANPVLSPRFYGLDLGRVKQLGEHFLCAGCGGPPTYEGVDLRVVRAGIDDRAFAGIVEDVVAVLEGHGVAPGDVDAAVGLLHALRHDQGHDRAAHDR